ncbi:glycosyltransferase involved in cell wall biosynthesis [Anseongella ginsenosidimutans]|uniref:Glycosyltransferase involved in cell wall biosynthesis n=1 Tax=Anseongella ginsenosidimutans TaxID=496056 RepID=A0A4R3KTK9_9SPHI|nr:glycosyltransferase [Anseongella ginsenosidimutans]QEC53399.1 glycosyltransferase [Anseongella ginsenosidimutans]TCS88290.1 glycosyltransferase involved in cell wall biosynthesis [Anseongella ginsenosidimutans]
MKIVILGPAYPYRGGLAAFNERLARQYSKAGHDVKLYTFSMQYPSLFFPGKTQLSQSPPPSDLEIIRIVNTVDPLSWAKAGKRIRREKPDLLIVRYWLPLMAPSLGTICKIVRGNGHTRIISIVDNIVPHERRIGDHLLTKYFVKHVDGFLVMSRSVLKELDRFDRKKPRVYSPHPIYDIYGPPLERAAARKALHMDPDAPYILFFGFIREYKGLDWLLEAFSEKRFRELKVRLIVAGEYYVDEKPYEHLIDLLEIRPYLDLHTHFIPDADVNKYFCAADVVVQPYKNATQSGITQIAYHYDKPMIVTNVGGLAEMVPHEKVGYVTRPHIGAIADAIHDFFTSGAEEKFITNIRGEKEKFSWNYFLSRIEDLC